MKVETPVMTDEGDSQRLFAERVSLGNPMRNPAMLDTNYQSPGLAPVTSHQSPVTCYRFCLCPSLSPQSCVLSPRLYLSPLNGR